jgi:nucleotide-binding universal stress UspA family protein
MYRKVIFPVDMMHIDQLKTSLATAGDLAKHYGAEICYVGVTSDAPSPGARNAKEYSERLATFAAQQAEEHGVTTTSKACVSHDPGVDTDKTLLAAISELGGDLVIMQTHAPNALDYIWAGHGDTIATHAKTSVFLVR